VSATKNALLGAAMALPIAAIGAGWYYRLSPAQQLKRGCWDQTLSHLVAPSTAHLVSYRMVGPNSDVSPVYSALKTKLEFADKLANASQGLYELLKSDTDGLYQSIMQRKTTNMDEAVSQWKIASAKSEEAESKWRSAQTTRDAVKAEFDAYEKSALSEVVLELDSQNRAGAMLRATATCSYAAADNSHVSFEQLDQR
jgi:hypothetical protein